MKMKMKKLVIGLSLAIGLSFSAFAFADNAEAADMHRLYNPNSGEHFYTANNGEKNNLTKVGWKYEGIGWTAPNSGTPVYRLYNKNAGDHHYTLNAGEKNHLVKVGWKYEGVGWYSDTKKTVKLYRAYNPNARSGSHNYTVNYGEQKNLLRVGWKDEGIAWYGINKINPAPKPPAVTKYTIKVEHKGSDGKLLKSTSTTVEKGKKYTANSASFSGYTLKGNKSQTITVSKNQTITFNYTKNPAPAIQKYNVTVVHKGTNGTELDKKTTTVEKGKSYTAKAGAFKGYTLQGNDTQTITVNGNSTITFMYKPNGVSKEEKKELQALYDKVKNTQKGNYTDTSWAEFQKQLGIAKNVLDAEDVQITTVNLVKTNLQKAYDGLVLNVPVEKFNVTIVYQDTDGDVLETGRGIQVEKGKPYTATAKTFEGYTLQGSNTQTVTINNHTTITFIYKKNVVEDLQTIENQLNSQALANINSHRNKNGKSNIKLNSILQQASTIRSRELAVKFDHVRPNGTDSSTVAEGLGYDKLHWNENIYMGSGMSLDWIKSQGASLIVNAWINSSGHNGTLLSNNDIEGAVGVYIKDNGNGKYNLYASYLPGEPLFSSMNEELAE